MGSPEEEVDESSSAKKICLLEQKINAMTSNTPLSDNATLSDKLFISEMGKDPDTGIIRIDAKVWPKLRSDLKSYVPRHNAATRHKDPVPKVPDGVTLTAKRRRMHPPSPEPPSSSISSSTTPTVTFTSDPKPPNPDSTDDDDDDSSPVPEKGISFGLGSHRPSDSPSGEVDTKRRVARKDEEESNILIFDTGGGNTPTITNKAWTVLADTGAVAAFQGYGPGTPVTQCQVVHAITKANIRGMDEPILLKVHHASLLEGTHEDESLLTLMDMVKSGVTVNGVTPTKYLPAGSDTRSCGITIDNTYLLFEYDDEKLFFRISQPTQDELDSDQLDTYHINGADIRQNGVIIQDKRRSYKEHTWKEIPTVEWSKRLGLAPTEVIEHTLKATTQHYLEVEAETRGDPRRHWVKRFKSLQYERREQTDATDTIFPSVKSAQGHTCSQFFSCVESKMWHVTPLKREQFNHIALQEHLRKNGIPAVLISDNATSETSLQWTKTCREFHIIQKTSEPHHPHQNPAEAEIGRLSRMVRRNMQAYRSPLRYNNWCQLYCCQINNVTARRSLGWCTPLEVHSGRTPDLSPFRFHWFEPVWYFLPGAKSPKANMAKARFLCLAESSGDLMTYYILTEPGASKPKILVRSVIRSRRKHVGTENEHTNDNPAYEDFVFTTDEGRKIVRETDLEDEHVEFPSPLGIPGPQGIPLPLDGGISPIHQTILNRRQVKGRILQGRRYQQMRMPRTVWKETQTKWIGILKTHSLMKTSNLTK